MYHFIHTAKTKITLEITSLQFIKVILVTEVRKKMLKCEEFQKRKTQLNSLHLKFKRNFR